MYVLSHSSRVQLSATPWIMAHQAPLFMGFSRKEYWSGLPFPSPVRKYEVSELKSLSCVRIFVTPWTAACQACLSFTISRCLLKLMSIEWVLPSNHLIPCCPLLLLLQSFPASESFPVSQPFASGGQSTGASTSASALPMNIQG